jgi:hypothetical protein
MQRSNRGGVMSSSRKGRLMLLIGEGGERGVRKG